MNSVKRIVSILFFVITTLLLAACGGGGGGGGVSAIPTAPAAGVTITPANAPLISSEVIGSVGIVQGFLQGVDLLPGVQVNVTGSDFNYADFFLQQLQQLPALALLSNDVSIAGVIIPPDTQACDFNQGTLTISGEVTDPNVLTVGDRITIKFYKCELAGIILNGTVSMTIAEIQGDVINSTPPYTLGVDVVLTVFSVNDGGLVASANGDLSMLLSENLINDENLVLSGKSLTAWSGGEVQTLTNYNYDLTWEADGDYSIGLSGNLASTVIGGSVDFESTVSFSGNENLAENPDTGILWLTTTADASQALLTAQADAVTVWIEVDTDGDGIYDAPIIMTWAELEAL